MTSAGCHSLLWCQTRRLCRPRHKVAFSRSALLNLPRSQNVLTDCNCARAFPSVAWSFPSNLRTFCRSTWLHPVPNKASDAFAAALCLPRTHVSTTLKQNLWFGNSLPLCRSTSEPSLNSARAPLVGGKSTRCLLFPVCGKLEMSESSLKSSMGNAENGEHAYNQSASKPVRHVAAFTTCWCWCLWCWCLWCWCLW